MYTNTIHLTSGVPIKIVTKDLPYFLEDEGLLQFTSANGEVTTFVARNVAYFSTKPGA